MPPNTPTNKKSRRRARAEKILAVLRKQFPGAFVPYSVPVRSRSRSGSLRTSLQGCRLFPSWRSARPCGNTATRRRTTAASVRARHEFDLDGCAVDTVTEEQAVQARVELDAIMDRKFKRASARRAAYRARRAAKAAPPPPPPPPPPKPPEPTKKKKKKKVVPGVRPKRQATVRRPGSIRSWRAPS